MVLKLGDVTNIVTRVLAMDIMMQMGSLKTNRLFKVIMENLIGSQVCKPWDLRVINYCSVPKFQEKLLPSDTAL